MTRVPRKIVWKIVHVGPERCSLTRDRRPVADDIHPSLAQQMIRNKITPHDVVVEVGTDGYETDVTRDYLRHQRKTVRKD